jgi:hypothetical protein
MRRRHVLTTVFLTTVVFLVSCNGLHQLEGTFQDLLKVQEELSKTLGYDDLRVSLMNVNGSLLLNVAVVNSPWKDLPAGQKNAKAIEIARLAYADYPSRSGLRAVNVTFAIHHTYLGFFNLR